MNIEMSTLLLYFASDFSFVHKMYCIVFVASPMDFEF